MKRILYPIFIVCSIFMLSSCEIDDDNLDDDIRRKFEQERNGSIEKPDKKYDANCKVSIGESAFLQSGCAVKVDLAGSSTGFKYYFSNSSLSENVVRDMMQSQKYVEGGEFNFALESYYVSMGTNKTLHLYVVGYDENRNYGPIQHAEYSFTSEWYGSSAYVAIDNIKKSGYELSWNFKAGYFSHAMDINFYVLEDEEADYASTLSDAELAVYIKFFHEYSATVGYTLNTPYTFQLDSDPKSVMVISKVPSPLNIRKLYKSF